MFAFYALALTIFVQRRFDGNASGLLYIGTAVNNCPEAWYDGIYLRNDQGYDGEFNYYISLDPFLRTKMHACTGTDAYRSQRVLMPLAASILSLGKREAIPLALICVNLFALLAGTWCLMKWCAQQNLPEYLTLIYAFSLGAVICLFRTTTEGSLLFADDCVALHVP